MTVISLSRIMCDIFDIKYVLNVKPVASPPVFYFVVVVCYSGRQKSDIVNTSGKGKKVKLSCRIAGKNNVLTVVVKK